MRSQASSEGRRTLTLLGCRARRMPRHDGRVAIAVLGRADAHVQPALGLVVTSDAGCLSNRFCSVLLCPCMGSIRFRSVSSPAAVRGRRPRARWARSAAFPQLLPKHESTDLADVLGFNFTDVLHQLKACHGGDHAVRARYSDFAICSCGGILQICQWYRVCDAGALRAEPLGHPFILRGQNSAADGLHSARTLKIPVWWRCTVLPSLPWVVCFLSFFKSL